MNSSQLDYSELNFVVDTQSLLALSTKGIVMSKPINARELASGAFTVSCYDYDSESKSFRLANTSSKFFQIDSGNSDGVSLSVSGSSSSGVTRDFDTRLSITPSATDLHN